MATNRASVSPTRMGYVVATTSYGISFQEYAAQKQEDVKKLSKISDENFIEKVADVLISHNHTVRTSERIAESIIIDGAELSSSAMSDDDCDDEDGCQAKIELVRNSHSQQVPEKTLMLAFPLEKKHRSFCEDCEARLLQNQDFIEIYLGREEPMNPVTPPCTNSPSFPDADAAATVEFKNAISDHVVFKEIILYR